MNNNYLRLLENHKYNQSVSQPRTIMEVSGYPHYENVCSNILSFYFSPYECHNLGDLILSSFLSLFEKDNASRDRMVTIDREYQTIKGNRIDIVIETNDYIIGIENKIYHWLSNDLEDYSKTLTKRNKYEKTEIKSILMLQTNAVSSVANYGFVSVTYQQLWAAVREKLPRYEAQADRKWLLYLKDFMETTVNLCGGTMQLTETDKFVIENYNLIENLLEDYNRLQLKLRQKITPLKELVVNRLDSKPITKSIWVYSRNVLVVDLQYGKYKIFFDLPISLRGWELQLWGRDTESIEFLLDLMKHSVLKSKLIDDSPDPAIERFLLGKWDIDADLGPLCDALCAWVEDVSSVANNLET